MLPQQTELNPHTIKLEDDKQLLYGLIYSLRPMKLKTLKTFIKTYLKTGLIQSSKSPTDAFILLNKKPNSNFCLCVNYRKLNNLIIKIITYYPLSVNN